jgi:hypothetical protein
VEWTKIGSSSDGIVAYVDLVGIRELNSGYRAWAMLDFPKPTAVPSSTVKALSTLVLFEISCSSERIRPLQRLYYTGYKGDGGSIRSQDELKGFNFPPPGTFEHKVLTEVCAMALLVKESKQNNRK